MKIIQFIQTTPAEFKFDLLEGVRLELKEFRKHYQPIPPTVYLTRLEVAKMLKVNISTVHNWGKAGKLTRHAIGNRIYFKRSEVEAAIIQL